MNRSLPLLLAGLFVLVSTLGQAPVTYEGGPLDRRNLSKTFGDEFTTFSWYEEDESGAKGGGTWRTNFGYSWAKPDDVRNRTLASNKEEQLYVDRLFRGTGARPLNLNPFSIRNGALCIEASKQSNVPALSGYKYVSGLITTSATFSQRYGVFELRAKLPKGKGLWPAFWLLPIDGSWPPEIDVMEILGHEPNKLFTTLHWNVNGAHHKSDIAPTLIADSSTGFHTYTVDWGPKEIVFYFDYREIARRPTPPGMDKPMYLLVNLAVGGNWPGSPTPTTPFPSTMEIDWIHVSQRQSYAQTPLTPPASTSQLPKDGVTKKR